MSYYSQQVSEENLGKVEAFFVRKTKETGSNRVEATVAEIAEGAEVALATAHKALKELERNSVLESIKPKSRRFPISYIYKKDIVGFEVEQNTQSQLEYLKDRVQQLQEELEQTKRLLTDSQVQNKTLEHRLMQFQR